MVNISSAYEGINTGLPCAKIQIGTEMAWQMKGDMSIESIEISSTVKNEASTCKIVLYSPTVDYTVLGTITPGPEFNVVKQGDAILVKLGYQSTLGSVAMAYNAFKGFISSAKVIYDKSGVTVIIECMDAKMWMMSGIKYEQKVGNKFSTIVRSALQSTYPGKITMCNVKILSESTLANDYLNQDGETDYQFLCRLAETTGCFFFIYLGDAYFISPATYKTTLGLTLSPCQYVEKVTWESDILGLSEQVSVSGFDPQKPKASVESRPVTTNLGNIGMGLPPAKLAKNINSATAEEIKSTDTEDIKYAQFIAQAKFTKKSVEFITCVATIQGYTRASTTDLKLGMGVKLSGYGQGLDNTYILTGIKHKYDREKKSFKTELTLNTDTCNKVVVA